MDEVLANMVKCLDADRAAARAAAVADTKDEHSVAVLTAIYTDTDPDMDALRAMGRQLDTVIRPPKGVSPPG